MYGHKTPSGNLVFLQQKWGMNIVKNHPVYLSDTISHFVPNTQVSTRGGYPKNRRCLSLTYESNVLCTIHIIQYISVCLCAQHTNAIYTSNLLSTRTLCSVVGGGGEKKICTSDQMFILFIWFQSFGLFFPSVISYIWCFSYVIIPNIV